jgi:hypothetical protein
VERAGGLGQIQVVHTGGRHLDYDLTLAGLWLGEVAEARRNTQLTEHRSLHAFIVSPLQVPGSATPHRILTKTATLDRRSPLSVPELKPAGTLIAGHPRSGS